MSALIFANVSKTYPRSKARAVDNISLTVNRGELFGLIGPDGAGKTTLMRIATTLLHADQGTVTVEGHDVTRDYAAIRRMTGYMPGRFSLYQDLSVEENLHFFATVFGTTIKDNLHLIADIYNQLAPFAKRQAGALSGGMKQKLALCCALIHEPQILFLDEPTTGVDPVSRREFWDMLAKLRARGITIFVSTPYMDEASRCDRIALIQHGRLIATNTLAGLLAQHRVPTYASSGSQPFRLLQALRAHPDVQYAFAFGQQQHFVMRDHIDPTPVITYLRAHGHPEVLVRSVEPNIEDVFIALSAGTSGEAAPRPERSIVPSPAAQS